MKIKAFSVLFFNESPLSGGFFGPKMEDYMLHCA